MLISDTHLELLNSELPLNWVIKFLPHRKFYASSMITNFFSFAS